MHLHLIQINWTKIIINENNQKAHIFVIINANNLISHLPDGGLGDEAFLAAPFAPAAISDFAGHVGNMLGSIAIGDSWKYSAFNA